jgi:phosphonate degradation associated HDIG domain protein
MIDRIRAMFERFGAEHYGENASQLAHALQCARLAQRDGRPESLVAAALLHDVGQFIDNAGNAAEKLNVDARHEEIGAEFLAQFFAPDVTEPVRLHVDAKRYLCAVEPDYIESLSDASLLSLRLQGDAMSAQEAADFARHPYFDQAVCLRRYDDAGKQPGLDVPTLESYFPMLERLAAARD